MTTIESDPVVPAGPARDLEAVPAGDADLTLSAQIDRLSLTQALIDFEVANARVLDLTARLVDGSNAAIRLQAEADAARSEAAGLRSSLADATDRAAAAEARADAAEARAAAIEASRSYRVARQLARIRGLLRP